MYVNKVVYECNWNHGFLHNKYIIYTNKTTTFFAKDNLHGIFHKAQNHLTREKGWQGNRGAWGKGGGGCGTHKSFSCAQDIRYEKSID